MRKINIKNAKNNGILSESGCQIWPADNDRRWCHQWKQQWNVKFYSKINCFRYTIFWCYACHLTCKRAMAPTMAKATNQQNHKVEGMAKRIEVANEGGKNLKELPLLT